MDAEKIGLFIRELRTKKDMTQKDLAERINCTDKAVSRWETGRGIPEVSLLMPLARVLDVSVNELLSGERFTAYADSETTENNCEPASVPDIINKADENLVSVMADKDREIKKKNRDTLILSALLCLQALILFVLPDMVLRVTDPAAFIVCASVANAFFVGFVRSKIKWLFPVFVVVMFMGFVVYESGFSYGKFALVFAMWYLAGALVVMLAGVAVGFFTRCIVQHIKKQA